MAIGGRNNRGNVDMSLTGQIDDFRVYVGVLTDDEVLDLALETDTKTGVDINADGVVDSLDADELVAAIISGDTSSHLDLNSDSEVNRDDIHRFLSEAAAINGFAESYDLGDANLDGIINAADLNSLGSNWQSSPNRWSQGDFDASGTVDAADLNLIGVNWQRELPVVPAAVPEPAHTKIGVLCALLCFSKRRKQSPVGAKRGSLSRAVTISTGA